MNRTNKIIFLLIVWIVTFHTNSTGHHIGVSTFAQADYHAARQNWSVSTSGNGKVYFANHTGLVEFDGTNWKHYKLPDETILRAVKARADSVVYTSGYMELGYWKSDKYGKLNYHSLMSKARDLFINNIEFWNIEIKNDFVYFQSFAKILVLHSGNISPIDFPGHILVMNKVNDKILVAVRNEGIYEIDNGKPVPYLVDERLRDKQIKFIIAHHNNQVLIGTSAHGIFLWDGEKLSQWNTEWTEYFIKNELNRGFTANNNMIITGTLMDGIVAFDPDGNELMRVNAQNGLPNNTVLGIDTDEWGNIWLALDNGIAMISDRKNADLTVEPMPGIGAIYSVAQLHNNLYLGTNQGLFVKALNIPNSSLSLIPETQGQVWDCKIIDDQLWVGHNRGTFLVNGVNAKLISTQSGGFAITPDTQNKNILIQCTYNNLVTYKKLKDEFVFSDQIAGFSDLIRYIEIDHLGNIWASHMYRGVYKVITGEQRQQVRKATYYGQNVFGKDHAIHVFKIENRIVFTNNEKLYTYDDLLDSIIPYHALNEGVRKYRKAHRIIPAPNHHYWFISKSHIGLFFIFQDSVKLIKEYPVSLFKERALVDQFENINPLSDTSAILCLHNGIAHLDGGIPDPVALIESYQPAVRLIELYTNRDRKKLLPLHSSGFKIKNNFHNIFFRFSFPRISEAPISYAYFLKGLNSGWSEPMNKPEFRFERLATGNYSLSAKAVDLRGNESRPFEISFEVLPPWYASNLAIVFYILALAALLFLFHNWGIRQTKRKERLQTEVREKELIRLRNEKLQNEIQHKSKELANSTMSIIKKNEFLLQLKKIIGKQKTELGSRYPDKYYNYLYNKIDQNISNQDDMQIFETNFERAHEQFLHKMKEKYPELSSNDLRLCAYLRMNLTSKEIAPLLGISVRGVENHRYRLRKKLNLAHNDSLTDTILAS